MKSPIKLEHYIVSSSYQDYLHGNPFRFELPVLYAMQQLSLVLIVCLFITTAPVLSSISLASDKWIPDKWRTEDDADLVREKNVDAIVATDEKMIDDIEERITFLRKTEDDLKNDLQQRLKIINNDDEDRDQEEGSGAKTIYVL